MTLHWTSQESSALAVANQGLANVDAILDATTAQRRPKSSDRVLFGAAIVFSYGVWENFVEQMSIETCNFIAPKIDADRVPLSVKELVEVTPDPKQTLGRLRPRTPWELNINPGWRAAWTNDVRLECLGDENSSSYGINTMRWADYERLAGYCGINPTKLNLEITINCLTSKGNNVNGALQQYAAFSACDSPSKSQIANAEKEIAGLATKPSEFISLTKRGVAALINLRGTIAHTSTIPTHIRKGHATAWRDFVWALTVAVDESWRSQAELLVAHGAIPEA